MTWKLTTSGVTYDCEGYDLQQNLGEPDSLAAIVKTPHGSLIQPGSVVEIAGQQQRFVVRRVTTHSTGGGAKVEVEADAAPLDDWGYRRPPARQPVPRSLHGQSPLGAIVDEAVDFAVETELVEPSLPVCQGYARLALTPKAGDEVVITSGEQRGWRGRVPASYDHLPSHLPVTMTRPDGTKVSVDQRIECVAKVLQAPPSFASQEDAEAWLTAMDREVRPAHVPGEIIEFTRTVRTKRENPELGGVLMKVVEDVTLTGKVLAFKPDAEADQHSGKGPAYKVLCLDFPGKDLPQIVWVDAQSVTSS